MAKKPARAANRTPYDGGGELTTPGSDVKRDDRPYTAWSLGGGEQVDPSYAGVNPAGATPVPWVSGAAPDVSPFNQANAAAMRGYTRNAPYLEKLVNDPRRMISEMQDLQLGLRENPNDPVAEYRLRILRQAMGDIYGIQPKEFMGYPTAPMYPTTGKR
jgi:hypothetical protein